MPDVGKTYRLKQTIDGRDSFTGADTSLQAGLLGEVIAIVPAAEDGAGDHEHDCAVIQFENGRTWSHSILAHPVSLTTAHHKDGAVTTHELTDDAPSVGWDGLFEEA